jgi:hypothetical protein
MLEDIENRKINLEHLSNEKKRIEEEDSENVF